MTMKNISLQNKLAKEWTLYTNNIYHYALILKEEYDQLKWLRNKVTNDYMVKKDMQLKSKMRKPKKIYIGGRLHGILFSPQK